jgi:CheY-like chemotaxis protein
MHIDTAWGEGLTNQSLEPILMGALRRFRALLPGQVELAVEFPHESPLVRANVSLLENAIFSACVVAWQSMAGKASQIVVEMKEVHLDEVVLDQHAEKLQGGLPPRGCMWLVITNGDRADVGPFHVLMQVPQQIDDQPGSAHRLQLTDIRDIVVAHQGTMTVSPEPGKGTAFEIFLPTAFPLETLVVRGSGDDIKHIFYVDDYEGMRALIEETFPDVGFRVTCFESGRDAMFALHANPSACDAVVTDYRLQGFSGVELLKQAKLLRPDLPVVVISGYVDDALKSAAYAAGAALVASKNSDLHELCMALRELLSEEPNPTMTTYSTWAKL